jgi:hypothetical protein
MILNHQEKLRVIFRKILFELIEADKHLQNRNKRTVNLENL